jgi:hypothetical protein
MRSEEEEAWRKTREREERLGVQGKASSFELGFPLGSSLELLCGRTPPLLVVWRVFDEE